MSSRPGVWLTTFVLKVRTTPAYFAVHAVKGTHAAQFDSQIQPEERYALFEQVRQLYLR
jgi:hypothetical protein